MTSLPSASNSTSVLPHQPSPIMAAFIMVSLPYALFLVWAVPAVAQGHQCMATMAQHNAQNTQYSMPPITQIHLPVTL